MQTPEPEGASRWSHDEEELFEHHAKSALQFMKTSDWKHADILWQGLQIVPLHETVQPEELGALAAFILSDEARHMTGSVVSLDAGRTAD